MVDEATRQERVKKYREQEKQDARVGYTVRRLSRMGRGIDEVLAHLFMGPKTLAELRKAMIEDRTKKRDDFNDTWMRRPYEHTGPDDWPPPGDEWLEAYTASIPVEWGVDHSMMYDVGQLSTANIIEHENGVLQVTPYYRDAVRVFLAAAFVHVHVNSDGVNRTLGRALHEEFDRG